MATNTLRVLTAGGKGGTAKTTTTALAICLLDSYGRSPYVLEVEREQTDNAEADKLRKLSRLLRTAKREVDVRVDLPQGLDVQRNPQGALRPFEAVMSALEGTRPADGRDVVIDTGGGIAAELLRLCEYADHGEITEGGEGIILIVCCKVDDASSIDDAEALAKQFRAIYPKGRVVGALTFVQADANGANSNAGRARQVMRPVCDALAEMRVETSAYMSVLYGQGFYWPARLAGYVSDDLKVSAPKAADALSKLAALDEGTQQVPLSVAMTNIARKRYLEWYDECMQQLDQALMPQAPGIAADPIEAGAGTAPAPASKRAVSAGSRV